MTNREKYAEQILDIACQGKRFTVDNSGNIAECTHIRCIECLFGDSRNCSKRSSEWANEEYKEQPHLTNEEKMLIDIINPDFKWIARDSDGSIYVYINKPIKDLLYFRTGEMDNGKVDIKVLKNVSFDMVKWEDEEPSSIDDLKALPVKK